MAEECAKLSITITAIDEDYDELMLINQSNAESLLVSNQLINDHQARHVQEIGELNNIISILKLHHEREKGRLVG